MLGLSIPAKLGSITRMAMPHTIAHVRVNNSLTDTVETNVENGCTGTPTVQSGFGAGDL